jgi:hypothetical protein
MRPATLNEARWACLEWHYAKRMPSHSASYAFFEDERYIGCIIFGRGANCNLYRPYGISNTEGFELVRVAFRDHVGFVSQYIMMAIRQLKIDYPLTRLCVSFADPERGHAGKIYQATNWIYAGKSKGDMEYLIKGTWRHRRQVGYGPSKTYKPEEATDKRIYEGRHRYLLPLDKKMRKICEKIRREYPHEAPAETAGANPTP